MRCSNMLVAKTRWEGKVALMLSAWTHTEAGDAGVDASLIGDGGAFSTLLTMIPQIPSTTFTIELILISPWWRKALSYYVLILVG